MKQQRIFSWLTSWFKKREKEKNSLLSSASLASSSVEGGWGLLLLVKNSPANAGGVRVQSLGREDPLEEGMAAHASILSWRIPWTEEAGGLQSMGPQSWIRLK